MLGIAKTEIVRAFKTISIRNGNCFENSKLSLPKWLHYSYLLSIQTGPNDKTITNAFAGLREMCAEWLKKQPIRLGGPGVIVHTEENCFFFPKPKKSP